MKPPPPPLQTHCDVPLKYANQRSALKKPAPGQHIPLKNRPQSEWMRMKEYGAVTPSYSDFAHIQRFLCSEFTPSYEALALKEWAQQTKVGQDLWSLNMDSLQSMNLSPEMFPGGPLSTQMRNALLPYYLRKTFFEELVLSTGSNTYEPKMWVKKGDIISHYSSGSLEFLGSQNLAYFKVNGRSYLGSRDHLLILADICSQRYLLMLYAMLSQEYTPQDFLSRGMLEELFVIHDAMLEKAGNAAYKLVYTFEPSCLARLVGTIPVGTPTGLTFLETITHEGHMISQQLSLEDLYHQRELLLDRIHHEKPALIIQAYGLYRIWGHPTIDPLDGAIALRKVSTKVRRTSVEHANQITCKFKEEFIIRYMGRHHSWPDLDVSMLSKSNVIRVAYENQQPFPRHQSRYRRGHLMLVRFNKLFPIDPKFDLVELLSDKALSLDKDELITSVTTTQTSGRAVDRSVLVKWMESELSDPSEFLLRIDREGFSDQDQVCAMREKEKEGKADARLFGLMTMTKRMYIVLTEAMLAEHILPYFPEITMLDDEISMDKKRQSFTRRSDVGLRLFTSLDFSKWNSHMRKNETLEMFRSFDQMFGLASCFSRTHEMFEDSSFYLLNGSYLPRFDIWGNMMEDLGSWTGHLGGIEGLRQKGWTLWTVILILVVVEDLPLIISLMGQGDNQIIREEFPLDMSREKCFEVHYAFLRKLDQMLGHIGPPLKLEETWTSEHLYVYGKYAILSGAPIAMSGKKLCRMYRLSNEDYPTIESALSACGANLSAAIASAYTPGLFLLIYYMEAISILQLGFRSTYLHRKPLSEKLARGDPVLIHGKDQQQRILYVPCIKPGNCQIDLVYSLLLLKPRCLGGFPVANIYTILLRGFPDEVTLAIGGLKAMYPYASREEKLLIRRILEPKLNPEQSFTLLMEHPTVLNLLMPPSPGEARRNLIVDYLKASDIVRNPYLQTFVDILKEESTDALTDYLMSVRPCNPRVLSMFAKSTAEARARQLAGKIQKTNTMSTLAREKGGKDLYKRISQSEANHLRGVLLTLTPNSRGTVPWHPTKCSVTHANDLREVGWGLELVGLDSVPPMEFISFEFPSIADPCPVSAQSENEKGYIAMMLDRTQTVMQMSNPLEMGSFNSYRGSITRAKFSGFGDKLAAVAEPILKPVLRLFSLIGWGITPGGNLQKLMEDLLEARTDLDPNLLIPDEERLAGSVHHRLQDERTGHGGAVTVLPNFGSKFMFDTFPLSEYSKGSKNVNLMFQAVMSMSTTLLGWLLSGGFFPLSSMLHLHVSSSCCVREVNEEMLETEFSPPSDLFMTDKESPFLYVRGETLETHLDARVQFSPTRNLSYLPELVSLRLASAVAEESFHLLRVGTWDNPSSLGSTQSLVINWTFRLNLHWFVYALSMRLAQHFSAELEDVDPIGFTRKVANKIKMSPVHYWIPLNNLIFNDQLPSIMVGDPYYVKISGNPVLSPIIQASNIQKWVVNAIICLPESYHISPSDQQYLLHSRVTCGVMQHPGALDALRQWIAGGIPGPYRVVRQAMALLILHRQTHSVSPRIIQKCKGILSEATERLTIESTDQLAKRAPELDLEERRNKVRFHPPNPEVPTCFVFKDYSRDRLGTVVLDAIPVDSGTQSSYQGHASRLVINPTSASYKLASILPRMNVPQEALVACLADGGGGFSQVFASLPQQPWVFYNTLIETSDFIQQVSPIPYIPAFARTPELMARVIGLSITREFPSDITHEDYPELVHDLVHPRFDIATCDAEGLGSFNPSGGVRLAMGFVEFCRRLNVQSGLFKTYLSSSAACRIQISVLLSYFTEIEIIRSDFSDHENTEVYLLATVPGKNLVYGLEYVNDSVRFSGTGLAYSTVPFLEEMRNVLPRGRTRLSWETVLEYSGWLDPSFHFAASEMDLYDVLPFFWDRKQLHFPFCVLSWIRSVSAPKAGVGIKSIKSYRTERLTKKILISWCMAWILVWMNTFPGDDIVDLRTLWEKGSFHWYRLNNGHWEVSLHHDSGPEPKLQGRDMYSIPLLSLLETKHLKILYRLWGWLKVKGIVSWAFEESLGTVARGQFTEDGKRIPKSKQAKNVWAREQLQETFNSNTAEARGTRAPCIPSQDLQSLWSQRNMVLQKRLRFQKSKS